jgi:DNA-binding PadR family transcriptional regulator
MRSYWLDLSNPAHRILYELGLSARGKTELEILKKLSHGSANMYELTGKLRDIGVHYSTVLRALRRLEKKKLVRIVSQRDVGRREKKYACSLLGDLVVALAKNGLSGAAQILAESSKDFRECVGVHLSFDSNHSPSLTESVIWSILNSEREELAMRSDLDAYVRNVELEWASYAMYACMPDFDDWYRKRTNMLRYLNKVVHISWINDFLVQVIEKYIEKEKEWLQGLEDFKREVKLARLYADKTEQAL